jgi:hypothetical protein
VTARPRPLLSLPSLLRLLVALIVSIAGLASGAGIAAAQNGVAAINIESGPVVGAEAGIPAGHVGSDTRLFDDGVSGCCVAPQAIDDVAAAGARGTTLHGTERIAGAGATRGGVLNSAEIAVVRGGGTAYAQSNGAVARVLQQANGRYSVVVDGNRGLITTFQNLSQNSLDRLAKNYGWTAL